MNDFTHFTTAQLWAAYRRPRGETARREIRAELERRGEYLDAEVAA